MVSALAPGNLKEEQTEEQHKASSAWLKRASTAAKRAENKVTLPSTCDEEDQRGCACNSEYDAGRQIHFPQSLGLDEGECGTIGEVGDEE